MSKGVKVGKDGQLRASGLTSGPGMRHVEEARM